MRWLEVNSARPLEGNIRIPGSKNSSLALLAASCICDEPVRLANVPDISDIRVVIKILESIGASIVRDNGSLTVDPRSIGGAEFDPVLSSSFRAGYYFIGALLAKHRKVTIGYPGGDNFVSRPIDQHIKGLNALGARVELHDKYYTVEADGLKGTEIYFDVITCGATINLMLAAVLASGRTTLHNASRDPEVVDTAILLNKMGAKVYGAGTDTIRVHGVRHLGGCVHSAAPDRLIAGAYLMAAGATGGRIIVEDVIPEHLEGCVLKLTEIGMDFEQTDNSICAISGKRVKAARIRTGKYPMFESDFQQPATVLMLRARGKSIISDRIYPQRFNHCDQLNRMGADISVKNGVARINSYRRLTGTWVHASDIRAGVALVIAGLIADGTTRITGVEHIERGYEDIVRDFGLLGADVRMCSGEQNEISGADFLPRR